jgi:hypothetical protein
MSEMFSDAVRSRCTEKTQFATSMIRQHTYQWLQSALSEESLLSLLKGIYSAFESSTPDSSPEICGICGETVPANSLSFGSCPKGHIFRTLLPLHLSDRRSLFNDVGDDVDAVCAEL